MNVLRSVPIIAALALTPGCKSGGHEQTATLPAPMTSAECGIKAGSRLTSLTVRRHEAGAVWRYHSDGYAPAIEQVQRAEGIEVGWEKEEGIVVTVNGKVAYILDPTFECGIATPKKEDARQVDCQPDSERTGEQRKETNDAYYRCMGRDPSGRPLK